MLLKKHVIFISVAFCIMQLIFTSLMRGGDDGLSYIQIDNLRVMFSCLTIGSIAYVVEVNRALNKIRKAVICFSLIYPAALIYPFLPVNAIDIAIIAGNFIRYIFYGMAIVVVLYIYLNKEKIAES